MTKTIDTLVTDVYNLFDPNKDHTVNEDNLQSFTEDLKEVLRTRLGKQREFSGPLRFSSLGKPDRQLWFEAHPIEGGKEELTPQTYYKFLYGDVIEALVLFLVKEAGHTVERQQEEIEVEGVKGHIDAIIDGVLVDVKSASPYGYRKFKDNTIHDDDPFGYIAQLSGYADVLTPGKEAAWLAMDKSSAALCVTKLSTSIINDNKPAPRIDHLKEVISSDVIPPLCYDPVPDGKSGNYKLPTACSYCAFKKRCHPNLRMFLYSTGPRYLTKVVKTPEVREVTSVEISDDA
jgi:hypothetical protein